MLNRKYYFVLLTITLLLLSPISSPGLFDDGKISNNAFTSGELNGISYSYGTNTYSASGNATIIDQGSISEETNTTVTTTESVRLITGYNSTPSEAYYRVNQLQRTDTQNLTTELWFDMAGFDYWVNQTILVDTVAKLEIAFPGQGSAKLAMNYTEIFQVEETYIVDQFGDYLVTIETNATYFEFFDYILGQLVHTSGTVVTKVIFFDVDYKEYTLEVSRSRYTYGVLAYYSQFSRAYNISATAHQVNITDGENFAAAFNMFDNISANYTEYLVSWMAYDFIVYEETNLKFVNGSSVPDQYLPFNMYPSYYRANGTKVEAGYSRVESRILSTYQNVLSAFVTVSEETTDNSLSIEARLAIWGISTSTTLVAYDDMNNNDRLDLSFGADGLEVSNDFVSHLGLAEAYEAKVFTAYYSSSNQSERAVGFGFDVNRTNIGDVYEDYSYSEYSFGNIDAASNSVFNWNEPAEDTDGNVVFSFGVTYNNFPVTWINLSDGTTVEDNENIAYDYIVTVNPTTGRAKISTTWTYGGIANAALQTEMTGKSLALLVKSEFFSIQALYTATENNDTVDSTTSSSFTRIGTNVGGDATEIDVTGPKQFYLLDGATNETATFDAINIVTVSGSFSGERTSPFNSESESTAGTSSKSVTETLDVNVFYSFNLIVINYPQWDGKSVVHDPDYSVNYEATANTVDEPSSEEDTSTPASDDTSTPVSDPPASGAVAAPGFETFIALFSFITMVVFVNRRK